MRRIATVTLTLALAGLAVAGCGSSSKSSSSSGGGSSGGASTGSSSTAASGSGYGGYGGYGKPSTSSSSSTTTAAGAVTLTAHKTGLGMILVGPNGHALYLFENDKSSRSTCAGVCATDWPPLTTQGAPTAAGSLKPSLLSTTKRSDGTMQVVYNGHPLYYYAGDQGAAQTNGQGLNAFGADWYVLGPSGQKVEHSGS